MALKEVGAEALGSHSLLFLASVLTPFSVLTFLFWNQEGPLQRRLGVKDPRPEAVLIQVLLCFSSQTETGPLG